MLMSKSSELDCCWAMPILRGFLVAAINLYFDFVLFMKLIVVLVLSLVEEVGCTDYPEHQHTEQQDGQPTL